MALFAIKSTFVQKKGRLLQIKKALSAKKEALTQIIESFCTFNKTIVKEGMRGSRKYLKPLQGQVNNLLLQFRERWHK